VDGYTTAISGATSATFTPPAGLTATTSYRRFVKDGTCNTTPTVSTGTWTVTVRPQFISGAINNTGETICYNTTPTFTIGNATSAGGGDGSITYQWQKSLKGDFTDAVTINSNTATLTGATIGVLTDTTTFRRQARDGTCNSFTTSTNTWRIIVRPEFTSGAITTTGETICFNGDPVTITSSAAASGGDGNITYKWQVNGADIASSNTVSYNPPSGLTITTTYTRFAKDAICNISFTQSTGSWQVIVRPTPTASIGVNDDTVCLKEKEPIVTFTNPKTLAVIITYKITDDKSNPTNGTINVNENLFNSVNAPTNIAGKFMYNLTSVQYLTAPFCSTNISGIKDSVVVKKLPDRPTVNKNPDQGINLCPNSAMTYTASVTNTNSTVKAVQFFWKQEANTNIKAISTTVPKGKNAVVQFVGNANPYTFSVRDSVLEREGCASDTTLITEKIAPAGPNSIVTRVIHNGNDFVCLNNTVQSYQWGFDDDNLNSNNFTATPTRFPTAQNLNAPVADTATSFIWVLTKETPANTGCYTRTYYNTPYTRTRTVQERPAEIVQADPIRIYPNPAAGQTIISWKSSSSSDDVLITVSDITGKRMLEKYLPQSGNGRTDIDVSNLTRGMYIVKVLINSKSSAVGKLIKE
jgi:hypothetical protein